MDANILLCTCSMPGSPPNLIVCVTNRHFGGGGIGEVQSHTNFFKYLNSRWVEFKFTMHYDQTQLSFLDTMFIKSELGQLKCDLYTKLIYHNGILHYKIVIPKVSNRPYHSHNIPELDNSL